MLNCMPGVKPAFCCALAHCLAADIRRYIREMIRWVQTWEILILQTIP